MRRGIGYLIAWALVTAVSVGAAWLGIRSVLVAAGPDQTAPLSAAQLRDAAGPADPVEVATGKPTTNPPTVAPAPRRTLPPEPTATPTAGPNVWAPESDGRGGTAYRRTFVVTGGEVVVIVAAGNVRTVSIKPQRGYTAREDRLDLQSIQISFLSDKHISRVYAAWRNGPVAEISESV